jgi:predicted chitinase
MFVAQVAHESANFTTLEEDSGKIKFTQEKFPKAKNPDGKAYDYFFIMYDIHSPAHNRQRVARKLGNTKPGDGVRYHGRGYIQLTGRTNYQLAAKDLKIDLENHPELAAQPENAARIAGWFWKTHKLNRYTRRDTDANFLAVTLRINGGYRGLKDRRAKYRRAKKLLINQTHSGGPRLP